VGEGMESQAEGAQQIDRAMLQLNDAAIRTSLSLRSFNQAAADLGSAVQVLEEEIARFQLTA
jgi:methyl-accepting chemotaxis protein WspA